MVTKRNKYLIKSDIDNLELTKIVIGFDEKKQKITTKVIHEKPLTIYLNNQEIVTLMSIGDHPKYLAIGYLLNQNMLKINDELKNIVYAVDVPQKDAALSNLPLTDSLYNLVSDNYGAKAIEYKHLKSFSDDGIAVFNEWNEHKNNV